MVYRFIGAKLTLITAVILIIFVTAGAIYLRISHLQEKLVEANKEIVQLKNALKHCEQYSKQYKKRYTNCSVKLSRNTKLIKELRDIFKYKPKDIKPKIVKKKECTLYIETDKKQDIILKGLSEIGKE